MNKENETEDERRRRMKAKWKEIGFNAKKIKKKNGITWLKRAEYEINEGK